MASINNRASLQNLRITDNHQKSPNGAFIRLHKVFKAYDTATGEFLALKGINAEVKRGEFVGIIGRSGAGKSTLVNMITGVDHLTSGEIWIDGVAVHNLDEDQMALWRGKNLGIVYQTFQLIPTLTLLNNILLPMEFCGLYKPRESAERAMALLEQVELQDHAHKLPSAISGGQQQRVAIARAIANDPPILVADEPTGNLDTVTAEIIYTLFTNLVKQGKTVIVVSHDQSLAQWTSRTITINDGEISNIYNN